MHACAQWHFISFKISSKGSSMAQQSTLFCFPENSSSYSNSVSGFLKIPCLSFFKCFKHAFPLDAFHILPPSIVLTPLVLSVLFLMKTSQRGSLWTPIQNTPPPPHHALLLTLNFEYVKLNFASHNVTLLYYGVSLLVYVFIYLSCIFFTKVSAFHGKDLYLFSLLYLYFQ